MSITRLAPTVRYGLSLAVLTSALGGCGPQSDAAAVHQVVAEASEAPEAASTAAAPSIAEWHKAMSKKPTPRDGCFEAHHPNMEWTEVPCVAPPPRPYGPVRGGLHSQTAGAGTDFTVIPTSGTISSCVGSFPLVSGVTSETGTEFGTNCSNPTYGHPNVFALQMNTNGFSTPACNGHTGCNGWQQFIYSNNGSVYMEYWLQGYGASCPTNWFSDNNGNCVINSSGASVPVQPIANLANLSLKGTVVSGGSDTVVMSTGGGHMYSVSASDSMLDLSQGWTLSEFNIFGDGCGGASQAVFNSGATIVVGISETNGTTASPVYGTSGSTAENNNLTLVPSSVCPTGGSTSSTGISFTETTGSGVTPQFCLLNDLVPFETPQVF